MINAIIRKKKLQQDLSEQMLAQEQLRLRKFQQNIDQLESQIESLNLHRLQQLGEGNPLVIQQLIMIQAQEAQFRDRLNHMTHALQTQQQSTETLAQQVLLGHKELEKLREIAFEKLQARQSQQQCREWADLDEWVVLRVSKRAS